MKKFIYDRFQNLEKTKNAQKHHKTITEYKNTRTEPLKELELRVFHVSQQHVQCHRVVNSGTLKGNPPSKTSRLKNNLVQSSQLITEADSISHIKDLSNKWKEVNEHLMCLKTRLTHSVPVCGRP